MKFGEDKLKLKNLFKSLYIRISAPNSVAKKLGVQFGMNCQFGTKEFGSEPNFIKIGDNFYSSSNVQFITHDGSVNVLRNLYDEYKDIDYFSPIIIGNNVFIGFGVVILPGSRIGDNVIVGAGSIVKGNLKSNSVYAGSPVKYICSIEEYANKNKDKFINTRHLSSEDKKKYINNWLIQNYVEFDIKSLALKNK